MNYSDWEELFSLGAAALWPRLGVLFGCGREKLEYCEKLSARPRKQGERGLWPRRFWEPAIRDEGGYERHVDYLHHNPVKHGQVARVADWPYSSFHGEVRSGS